MLMRRFIDNQCSKSEADWLIRAMASKGYRQHFGELAEEALAADDAHAASVDSKRIEENFEQLESRLSRHRLFKAPKARHWLMGSDLDQQNFLLNKTTLREFVQMLRDDLCGKK